MGNISYLTYNVDLEFNLILPVEIVCNNLIESSVLSRWIIVDILGIVWYVLNATIGCGIDGFTVLGPTNFRSWLSSNIDIQKYRFTSLKVIGTYISAINFGRHCKY